MRFLRVTHWPHPDNPVMMVVPEEDMKLPAIEAVEDLLKADKGFFTYEIFEAEGGMIAVTSHATKLTSGERGAEERNMAILYHYDAGCLAIVKEDGILAASRPAPLAREDVAWVMRHIARHPDYKGQSVIVPIEDGTTVKMKNGEVLPNG